MDKLNSLHKLLQESFEDESLDPTAKIELSLADFHIVRAIEKQSIIENENPV